MHKRVSRLGFDPIEPPPSGSTHFSIEIWSLPTIPPPPLLFSRGRGAARPSIMGGGGGTDTTIDTTTATAAAAVWTGGGSALGRPAGRVLGLRCGGSSFGLPPIFFSAYGGEIGRQGGTEKRKPCQVRAEEEVGRVRKVGYGVAWPALRCSSGPPSPPPLPEALFSAPSPVSPLALSRRCLAPEGFRGPFVGPGSHGAPCRRGYGGYGGRGGGGGGWRRARRTSDPLSRRRAHPRGESRLRAVLCGVEHRQRHSGRAKWGCGMGGLLPLPLLRAVRLCASDCGG